MVPPDRVARIVRTVTRAYEDRRHAVIHTRLLPDVRARLDALLEPAGPEDTANAEDGTVPQGRTDVLLIHLRAGPGRASVASLRVVQNRRFMSHTESGQSRANQGIPRFACNPDLNHALKRSATQRKVWKVELGSALIPSAQAAIPLVPTTCRSRSRKEAKVLNHTWLPAVNRVQRKTDGW